MPNRRARIAMTDDEVREYLRGQRVLNVATLGPTGHPHLVAMWYAVIDDEVQFWTFAKSQKIVNLRRDPRMTGLVESGDSYDELKGVELVGSGVIIDDPAAVMRLGIELAIRYNGPAAGGPEARAFIEQQAHKRLAVEFHVDRIVSWDHTKLAGW